MPSAGRPGKSTPRVTLLARSGSTTWKGGLPCLRASSGGKEGYGREISDPSAERGSCAASRSASPLCEKRPQKRLLLLVPDPREQFFAEGVDGLRAIEGEALVHDAAFEMAGAAAGF